MYKFIARVGGDLVTLTYPLAYSLLKDEALDEANIIFYNSHKECYPPGTNVSIEIYDHGLIDKLYFIVSLDKSYNLPIGSDTYKHEMSLIEETKELEGIPCSSLTFTNTVASTLNPIDIYASKNKTTSISSGFYYPEDFTSDLIQSPVALRSSCYIPSINELGNAIIEYIKTNTAGLEIASWVVEKTYQFTTSSIYSSYLIFQDEKIEDITQSITLAREEAGTETIEYYIVTKAEEIRDGHIYDMIQAWELTYIIDFIPSESTRPWTITDCVNRVLECAEPLFLNEIPKYHFDGVVYEKNADSIIESSFPYLEGSQAEKYDKVLAPEFTMTQCTLREQLKVIGSFIHAEPRLRDKTIYFVDYGISSPASIEGKEYVYKSPNMDINSYSTALVSNASNIVSNSDTDVATIHQFGRAVMSEDITKRTTEYNAVAKTDKPIHSISKFEVKLDLKNLGYVDEFVSGMGEYIDITYAVLESTDYFTLASDYKEGSYHSKSYSLYYTIGEPNVRGLFYLNPARNSMGKYYSIAWILGMIPKVRDYLGSLGYDNAAEILTDLISKDVTCVKFRITYTPYYDAVITHGKAHVSNFPSYKRFYNQGENAIDTQYYGENIKGVAARMGNEEQERTYILTSYSDIPTTSQSIDGFAISSVTIGIYANHIKCTVLLSKDFNRISEYVGINSIKRLWEVSEREVYNRDILIHEQLIVSDLKPLENYVAKSTIHSVESFISKFFLSDGTSLPINLATGQGKLKNNKIEITKKLCFPIITSSFGNATTSALFAKDNYSCGERLVDIEEEDPVWGTITGKWAIDEPYGDFFGRIFWFDFEFLNATLKETNAIDPTINYPNAKFETNTSYISTNQLPLRLRKDSRERITINCTLEAKSNSETLYIGSAFAECNPMVYKKEPNKLFLYTFNYKQDFDKFATNLVLPSPSAYSTLELNSDNTKIVLSNNNKIAQLKIAKQDYLFNKSYGYIIATPPTTKTIQFIDDNNKRIESEYLHHGKILLTCTSKDKVKDELNLYFYITR